MRKVLLCVLLFSSVSLAKNPLEGAENKKACPQCDLIESTLNGDTKKGASDLVYFLSVDRFSKKEKQRKMEIDSTLKAAARLIDSDEDALMADYLLAVQRRYPKLFKTSFSKLSASDQEHLDQKMKAARRQMQQGEKDE